MVIYSHFLFFYFLSLKHFLNWQFIFVQNRQRCQGYFSKSNSNQKLKQRKNTIALQNLQKTQKIDTHTEMKAHKYNKNI